jgi:hypothetical protein
MLRRPGIAAAPPRPVVSAAASTPSAPGVAVTQSADRSAGWVVVGGVEGVDGGAVAASPQARVAARRAGRPRRLANAGIPLSLESLAAIGETTVSKRGSLGGLALIEVVIAIVLVGMLCAVAVAALAA